MTNKIKVLHLIKSLGRGGAETLLPGTLRLHDKQEFEFHYIYFLPWKNQLVAEIADAGGTISCISAVNNIQLIFRYKKVRRYIRQHNIGLIHAHLPWAGILARLLFLGAGVKVIYTEHNKQERYHRLTRLMNLATMNWENMVIAVSDDVADSIRTHKRSLGCVLTTVHNGVDVTRFRRLPFKSTNVRDDLGIPSDAIVVGTVAVFRFQKRLDIWLRIADTVLSEHSGTHFILVGDGPLKKELIALKSTLKQGSRIHFAGLQTEVRPYLAAIDIYLMTSIFEGLPIAMLEAMAMECPVVATNAGGVGEVVRHETEGFLCPVDSPLDLVNEVRKLIRDPALREQLGTNARTRVSGHFSLTRMTKVLEEYYRDSYRGTELTQRTQTI